MIVFAAMVSDLRFPLVSAFAGPSVSPQPYSGWQPFFLIFGAKAHLGFELSSGIVMQGLSNSEHFSPNEMSTNKKTSDVIQTMVRRTPKYGTSHRPALKENELPIIWWG